MQIFCDLKIENVCAISIYLDKSIILSNSRNVFKLQTMSNLILNNANNYYEKYNIRYVKQTIPNKSRKLPRTEFVPV